MRIFPRTARRGLAAAATVGALALGALAVPSTAVPLLNEDLKDRQRKVERRLDSASSALDESSASFRSSTAALRRATARLATAQSRLTQARARLTAAEVRDRQMAAELAEAVRQLADARAELHRGRRQVSAQRDQVADVVAEIYTAGDPDLLAFASLLESETTADLTRRAEMRNVVVGEETRTYDELRAAEVLLSVEEDKVERARDAVAERRRAAAEHLATMESLEADAEDAAAAVRSLVADRSRAQARAERARQRDLRSLRTLEREQDRIQEMLRRRAEAARARARARARAQAAAAARRGASRSAGRAAAGGYLDYPVRGYVTSPFGMRSHPIYGYRSLHDGVDFGSGCGAPLYAAAPGRVLQRYYSGVWGNRLIVANGYARGKDVATIYNHAARYVVSAGESVSRGQLVGYMGSSGWSTGCHLHFTVMANGRAVDPMKWF